MHCLHLNYLTRSALGSIRCLERNPRLKHKSLTELAQENIRLKAPLLTICTVRVLTLGFMNYECSFLAELKHFHTIRYFSMQKYLASLLEIFIHTDNFLSK